MERAPNVFLLSADSLRADAFAGAAERLADELDGTRFATAVAPAPFTASSVPALATGRFVDGTDSEGEAAGGSGDAGDDAPSLLARFREAGYETVLLTDNPLIRPALDETGGEDEATEGGLTARFDEALPRSLTRVVERGYFDAVWPLARRLGLLGPYYRSATTLHDRAEERLAAADGPVFCWIHYMDTHTPYWPPTDAPPEPGDYRTSARSRSLAVRGVDAVDPADLGPIRALYDRSCDALGAAVERFVARLRDRGHYDPDRDVLALTADHGENFEPDRGLIGHVPAASWESLVRVPLVVARPDWPASVVADQVSLIDLPRMLAVPATAATAAAADGPGPATAPSPPSFAREHAFTVARTLGATDLVHGVRRDDGEKLFGRRTADGIDALRTVAPSDDPAAERVRERRPPDAAPRPDPESLSAVLAARGGPAGEARDAERYDEAQLRALGYLE
ncbi:sulfatase-like hydrolase/transferase [Halorubrum rutilum]|uniref:Sulfatase-like hydrolase/transferase n=1 Tax=Halorubrum rutilum TaxID=1364933 RepID=A0ABD6AGT9_9EURY|nr:sulfatase-like hydrolase/transferase [Halorubrum rutilum]